MSLVDTSAPDDWDAQAATFDDEPDHGLRDAAVRSAWSDLILPLVPPAPSDVADIGCGTGSLSLLLAAAGHRVRGLDLSRQMLAAAERKAQAAGVAVGFDRADAADPPYRAGSFDAVVVRHLLWALSDKDAAVARWAGLLRPSGVLLLIEGRWSTGAGVSAAECREVVLRHRDRATVRTLADPALWGRVVDDERYLVVSSGTEMAA
jgi:SAM-dependent methyltransferase